jgi:hypothetical protein
MLKCRFGFKLIRVDCAQLYKAHRLFFLDPWDQEIAGIDGPGPSGTYTIDYFEEDEDGLDLCWIEVEPDFLVKVIENE